MAATRRHPSTDVNTLLKDTFKGNKDVKSGKLNLALKVDAKGGTSALRARSASASRARSRAEGKQKLPKFDIDFAFEGAGQSIKAGLTSTGDKGFVNFQGTDYAVSDQVFQQFKAGYEQAQKNGTSSAEQQSLSSLGLDPQPVADEPQERGRREGRRRRHDQDHRRHRRQQAARRRQHGAVEDQALGRRRARRTCRAS